MTLAEKPRRDEWVTDNDTQAKLDLFIEVGDAMRAAARRGLRRRTRTDPSEHDVEEVLVQAFNELWMQDQTKLDSPVSMGCKIAVRRGFDRGSRIARERRTAHFAVADRTFVRNDDTFAFVESEYMATMAIVRRCQEHLTQDQREVIDATVEGTTEGRMPLRKFAEIRGTTYEACRRMRERGIATLTKCVETALATGTI